MNAGQSLDYEYRGLLASTWDVWRDDTANWADRKLFLDVIRRYGQPVLDVGCSTGRLILDFIAHGIDCDGVDLSPEMLDIARAKAAQLGLKPNVYLQSMDALGLSRRYRTIRCRRVRFSCSRIMLRRARQCAAFTDISSPAAR